MQDYEFWNSIRNIAQADPKPEAPQASVDQAYAIFNPPVRQSRLLTLKPAFGGMVRKAGPDKRVYELDDTVFVELSHEVLEEGVHVHGFAAGVDAQQVLLMAGEKVFKAELKNGEFDFSKSIPAGCYAMTFQHQGESHWIRDLQLGQTN